MGAYDGRYFLWGIIKRGCPKNKGGLFCNMGDKKTVHNTTVLQTIKKR